MEVGGEESERGEGVVRRGEWSRILARVAWEMSGETGERCMFLKESEYCD